jgi:hypothetical protein
VSATDKSWIVYGLLGGLGCPGPRFNYYNGTKWIFNKTKYREHLKAIAGAGANAIRRIPSAGAWDAHPDGKKGQFCEYRYVSESVGWDLDDFNEAYFDTVGEAINIENSLGLTTIQCFADNCVYHKATTKKYSPWYSNNNGIDTVFDTDARPYYDALIDKYLSEFSGKSMIWAPGNEMNNAGFPGLFNAVIHPLVDAGTLDPDKLTYGTYTAAMTTTVRAYLANDTTRNKVIMEAHEGPTSSGYKARYTPWSGTQARMLFSDDGCYSGTSTCDKIPGGARPSAAQWYTAALDVLTTYGAANGSDNKRLSFEHCPAGYDDLSTTCQAATIAKIREAYEVWVATTTGPPPPPGATIPVAPSGLTATISGATTVTLAWTDNSINELDFHIEKSTTTPGVSGFAEIATVAANVVTYGATGLTEGASVWFRVRAHNATGYSDYTSIVLAVVPSAVSTAKPTRRLANLPYPFGFKSLDEVRDYLIKLRSKLVMADFTINLGDIINPSGNPFVFPMDGVLYEMLKCDEEVLSWGWREGIGNTFLGLDVIVGGDTTGGYDTYLGYQAGYYSTTATANVVVGAGAGTFLRTTYTIDPNVDYQFALRRTGGAQANSPYALFEFGDYLISREYQPNDGVHEHRIAFLKSADGTNWSDWFYIDTYSHYKGYSCVEFSGKLYINWYNASPNPRLQVWDGNTITTKLTSVAQGNYLAGPMIVSGAKLWILTDVTPGYDNNRRVAYWTADGTTYNAVTDYDFGTDPHSVYLHYNHESYLPAVGGQYIGKFLCNRWLEFKDVLYLFASIYNTANAKWSWQVWQAGTTTFTKIYDSAVLNDGYVLSSVVTDGEFIVVTGNTIESEGNYEDDCRVYRSTDMITWGIVATLPDQGLCYESMEYGNIFYSMFVIQAASDYYVKLYYWDDENSEYVQCDNSITTEDHYISGNFIEYKGSFFVGKWKEIYELTRAKSTTITVTDKFASGNTIVGAAAGDMPISGNLDCLYGYNSNLSSPEIENGIAIGAYSRVSRDNTLVLGGTDTYQVDVAIGQTYAIGRLHIHQYGEKEIDTYGLYIDNIATNTAFDGINKYGLYVVSTGTFTGSTGTGTKNYGFYLPAVTGADTNYGFYSVSNVTTEDQFISSLAIGTAPIVATSTTVCTNLNAGLVDGYHHNQSLLIAASPTFVALNLSATSNQIVLQSAGVTGTITATPASSNKVWTLQNVTGTIYQTNGTDVAVADGGTGKSSFTQYAIPYASAATTIGEIAIGTAGQVLAVNGGANGYEWIAAGGGGTFLSLTDVDEADYVGHAGHFVVVDGDEDALIFSASSVATHDILSVTHGDTLASAVSVGSMIFGNATPKWAELGAGVEGQILEMGATLPGWGRTITISDSAASGGSNGDIWLEY